MHNILEYSEYRYKHNTTTYRYSYTIHTYMHPLDTSHTVVLHVWTRSYIKMPKHAVNRHTYIHTYIHLDKDMERERGRKSYLVHNMRQDLAILCSKSNTIATKPVSGPLLEGER